MLFKRFGEKLRSLFGGRKIDDAFFDELEDTLIEGDLGARLTDEIITELREISRREKITEAEDLRARMKEILSGYIKSYEAMPEHGKVNVYMILGVNGVGKTTSIAKLAYRYKKMGKTTFASIIPPENWDEVVNFAESPRGSYEEIRKARPDMDSARTALNGYLEAIKLENCEIQDSYINSLGLR